MTPLFVDLHGKKVVIFGGGAVGARKAGFFAGETGVTVFSRSFDPSFSEIDAECREVDLSALGDRDLARLLEGAAIAVAATQERELNDRIGRLAKGAGILFNNADGESGDLLIPSVVKGKNYALAIGTGGVSPAISRYLREHIQRELPCLDRMIALQGRLRNEIRRTEPSQEKRRELLYRVLEDREVWNLLPHGEGAAWNLVKERYL
ncbi:precorrin-2 dehydrogenase/sirohydrochlorin ferrochelatase [Methanolinea mesophila]|uniref:precorrin-2 dehydrogenase/sirohydrochlorin ferrochelatase family protein n=1 Tax=Methanolinea mesophila TaxID=547055 RepID=UPI001AE9819F|nr:bifunctional precorrin-2 dehydrogenase/sirohydrochlorin ferrochelatase [Methanolinea mesophila]MBP1929616.1 precorrin-2 dehydrogenase/sirohydrochlorin ferrochelatase [Methanolinea mesophila]